MVTPKRQEELKEIAELESFLQKNVNDESEANQLFSKEDIEVKTDLSEEEISIIARFKFLCDELGLENFRTSLTYLMELRVSKGRKSRKEFLDAIKKEHQIPNFNQGNNMGGFTNGVR